jgi:Oxidoreductase molybdopterin binding domain
VPLSSVLSLAGILLGDALRGPRMSDVLVVGATDGYKVVFALAETDPAFATREIIIADKRDGKPLDAKEGPLRIVVPGDKRPARWVRQVITLKIVDAK